MDLKDFYFNNVLESEYHYRFYDFIENVNKVYNILMASKKIRSISLRYSTLKKLLQNSKNCANQKYILIMRKQAGFIL